MEGAPAAFGGARLSYKSSYDGGAEYRRGARIARPCLPICSPRTAAKRTRHRI